MSKAGKYISDFSNISIVTVAFEQSLIRFT